MAATKRVMTEALEELVETDLQEFKQHLWNGVTSEITPILREKLEESDYMDVVDCMIQQYSDDAGKIAVQVLRKIKQNDLAHRLESKLKEAPPSVHEESRNAPVSVEELVQSSASPHTMTPCSQQLKTAILKREKKVYIPKDRSQRKRLALLITNIKFEHFIHRDGAERDEENMEWLLTALGYSVEKHTNLSGNEIDSAIRNFAARSEHKDSDSTFVVLMSHGEYTGFNEEIILGVNYHPERNHRDYFCVDDIYSHLNSEKCPALINKPKVFLIQNYIGEFQGGSYLCSGRWMHVNKDFVCFTSRPPGIPRYGICVKESFFVNYIVEVFCERAHNDDIMELFREVSSRMDNDPRFPQHCKILPSIQRVTLTKKFYLFPGH